jgi:tRNA/tmRNA/rRNA uracil-C5-methylase (TrmA/RlmC/RlmD family)
VSPLECPHRPPCPGCPRFGERGAAPAALARLGELSAGAGLPLPKVVCGKPLGFRHRVRLAVRGRANNPKIGLFELGSHRVVHIPDCRVHHPLINEVARTVRAALADLRISPYSDAAHAGRIRYLQIVVERASQSAQLVIVSNETAPDGLEPLFARVGEQLGSRLHSLHWNGNPERTNTILGPHWQRLSGPDTVVETVAGVRLHYPPGAFGQSNLPLADAMAARVRELVPDASSVLELYAGVGALGLPLAARSARLDVNELGADSLAGLARGREELEPEVSARVHIHPGSAESCAPLVAAASTVLVDPPRRGLDRGVLDALLKSPPERLIYVSCGIDSFLEQTRELLASGRFALEGVEVFVLFPYSEHVETVAWFRRG